MVVQLAVQLVDDLLHFPFVLARAHVEMQDGVLFPFLFQLCDGQAFEEVLAALEVVFQRAAKEALAEPARTAEEDELRFVRQLID